MRAFALKTCFKAALVILLLTTGLVVYYEDCIVLPAIKSAAYSPQYVDVSIWISTQSKDIPARGRRSLSDISVTDQCQFVLDGNITQINYLTKNGVFPWREIYDDAEVSRLSKNCQLLKRRYRFPPYFMPNVTIEELDFPIAYSILVHKNVNQLLILLSALYRDHNIHCIHIDKKASVAAYTAVLQAAKCFPNVFVSTTRENVRYAEVSRLLADIACMRDLLRVPDHTYSWKYLINLCSQDFPARTNMEIVRQLKELRGFNSIGGYSDINDEIRKRTRFVWKLSNITKGGVTEERPVCTNEVHRAPPYNMTVVKCLAYNLYTREFLQWALLDSKVGPELLEWSKDTYSPDEHYWLMLHRYPGAPGGSELATGYQISRTILWGFGNKNASCYGEWRHGICVLGAADVHRVIKARDLFINKFDVTLDSAGPTCMREILDERATVALENRRIGNRDKLPDVPSKSFFKKSRAA